MLPMDAAKVFNIQELSMYDLEKGLDLYMDILWTTIVLSSIGAHSSHFIKYVLRIETFNVIMDMSL